ncbi:hypothetical protein [Streptomyces sp. NPDC021139]|uniref:hypothetical protein n=1 Tax=unclassified Streptomyces TaxID=2593676 RepID=UPI0033F87987
MPAKDELARRRHEKLVDRLETLVRAGLKPQYEGYYGQLILSRDDLTEVGKLKDVRRAAREAGGRPANVKGLQPVASPCEGTLGVTGWTTLNADVLQGAGGNTATRSGQWQKRLFPGTEAVQENAPTTPCSRVARMWWTAQGRAGGAPQQPTEGIRENLHLPVVPTDSISRLVE